MGVGVCYVYEWKDDSEGAGYGGNEKCVGC